MINKENDNYTPALVLIINRLMELGYTSKEAEYIVARLLEEEAEKYLKHAEETRKSYS